MGNEIKKELVGIEHIENLVYKVRDQYVTRRSLLQGRREAHHHQGE